MDYKTAKNQLQHALNHQQTISIHKLRKLMQNLNMSVDSSRGKEVEYLKNEIKKLKKENRNERE